ncbi:MAG: lycopene cyclase domain-containing protein, partial [Rubricoccaceae bacterium]|nr:lycopene cyclase domain-containing protein [Rubricoccaceae bacterium]
SAGRHLPSSMTYLQFHLVFLGPPLLAMGALASRRWRRGAAERDPTWAFWLLPLIAFVYTTPWDNYLVANAVWTYPPGAVLATIGYVPVEEYLFFLLQPILTGLWYRLVRSTRTERTAPVGPSAAARWVGAGGFAALTLVGAGLVAAGGRGLYLGLILAWACPVLAGMWALSGRRFWRHRRLLLLAVAPPTVYLWIADRVAIGLGIWDITDATRTGAELLGLPVEEALFFLLTNLLVVQGLLMFAEEPAAAPG